MTYVYQFHICFHVQVPVKHSVLHVKALVGAFNQQKALIGGCPTGGLLCESLWIVCSSSEDMAGGGTSVQVVTSWWRLCVCHKCDA